MAAAAERDEVGRVVLGAARLEGYDVVHLEVLRAAAPPAGVAVTALDELAELLEAGRVAGDPLRPGFCSPAFVGAGAVGALSVASAGVDVLAAAAVAEPVDGHAILSPIGAGLLAA